jgi:undecaprenyl-diphosphatase
LGLYFKLFVAFIPAVVLGLLFSDLIDELLEASHSCCFSLLGGIVLLKVDQWFNHSEDTKITYLTAFKIGLYQCLNGSGVSRSGASIVVECLKN